jgi:pseudaminic acid cytidylyltransferase
MNRKRLAIIPARKGSKRIKNKNTREFSGVPMIHHILKAAKCSDLFFHIHVSTDCEKVASISSQIIGDVKFLRPASLADDKTPILDVLLYCMSQFEERGWDFDEYWLLMACSPLLSAKDLNLIAADFEQKVVSANHPAQKMLSVAKYPAPIDWAYTVNDHGELEPLHPQKITEASEVFKDHYFDAGSFCVYTKNGLRQSVADGYSTGYVPFVLPAHKCIDIDTQEDWDFALKMYQFKEAER